MIKLKDDNGKPLPKKVQKRVNDFIESLKTYPWLQPSPDLKKEDVEKQAKFTLKCFGIEAEIEYRKLEKKEDWDSARDSARDSAWASAWDSARASAIASAIASARDSAWDSARASAIASAIASARDSAWDSAIASAWASVEILLEDNKNFKKEYPNGVFKQLLKLWEMGLYLVGVSEENEKFVIYVPPCKLEFPDL